MGNLDSWSAQLRKASLAELSDCQGLVPSRNLDKANLNISPTRPLSATLSDTTHHLPSFGTSFFPLL